MKSIKTILLLLALTAAFSACEKEDESPQIHDITLNASDILLGIGDTKTLIATIEPEDVISPEILIWTTGNPAIATVTNGVVTAVGMGTTTVRVSTPWWQ
jgi:uncharacterized protein YjdB